ncbi:MAG: hypothetical protein HXL40_02605 [Solobacterium sp.]|jgi:hypothetical protein|nr:hypothetical protein [Solobacterium sp.]
MNSMLKKISCLIVISSSAIVAFITEKSIEAMRRKRVIDSTLKEANNESGDNRSEKHD